MAILIANKIPPFMMTKAYPMNILEQIRIARECKGLSQAQLAEKISVNHATYGKIERGENELTVRILIKIAKALDITLTDLIAITGKTPAMDDAHNTPNHIMTHQAINHFHYCCVTTDQCIETLIHQLKTQNDLIIQKDQLLAQQTEQIQILHEMLASLKNQVSQSQT